MTDKAKTFFKYHKINDHLFYLLKNKTFWFSSQAKLNDPYDCKYSLTEEYMTSLCRNSCNEMLKDLKEQVSEMSGVTEEQFYNSMLPIIKSEEWQNGFHNLLFGDMGWSVCRFSTDPLNELMWAHYADSNNGVCLEFDLSATSYLYEKIFEVNYNDTFPLINSMEELPEALLTKRQAWLYEKEWRILSNVKGTKTFDINSLTGIIFGYKVKKETINSVRTFLIENDYKQVRFKQVGYRVNNIKYRDIDNFPKSWEEEANKEIEQLKF